MKKKGTRRELQLWVHFGEDQCAKKKKKVLIREEIDSLTPRSILAFTV